MPPAPHYPNPAERTADKWVHIAGLAASLAVGIFIVVHAAATGGAGKATAMLIYAAGLVVMFGCSMAYNMARDPVRQQKLRRLDHAAIYLLIACTYTPFVTQSLSGGWALGMSIAVWAIALLGIVAKLALPSLPKWLTVASYLALGWIVVVALPPLARALSPLALALLAAGGLIYTLGVPVYVSKRVPYRRAIWHGFVLTAAALQCAAVIVGVSLSQPQV